ncbi:MAG: 50S ribosomal protein L19 [Patescibacteria group bacterium]
MARSFKYKDKVFSVGETLDVEYKIKEGDKERKQKFTGILLSIKGASELNRMITIRKISKAGIGVEKILPLSSPNIVDIKTVKQTSSTKSKVYYIRNLSQQAVRAKIYSKK